METVNYISELSTVTPEKIIRKRKKNCCIYCKGEYSNISIHLELAHGQEKDVKEFAILPKGSAERKKIIELLRKRGNFEAKGFGHMIPVRLPRQSRQCEYVVCPKCKGIYNKNFLRRHYLKCDDDASKTFKHDKSIMIMSRKLSIDFHPTASETLKTVCSKIREDEVCKTIRWDSLIVSYGNKLCNKLKDPHHYKEIRAKLRLLGRFLLKIKKVNKEITDFASIYHPKYYNDVLKTTNELANLNENNNVYKNPVTATSLGIILKKVGRHLKTFAIKNVQNEKLPDIENFIQLLQEDYATSVNKTAIENLNEAKRKKTTNLPTIEDISTFYEYLCNERNTSYKKLRQQFSADLWKTLASYTLTSLQVFNRRRSGEIERMLISDYNSIQAVNLEKDKDIFANLGIDGKTAANEFMRIPIRGKLGRNVAVIVDKSTYRCLRLIVQERHKAGVLENNPYIFGLPGLNETEYRHLDACALMRELSQKSGVKNPENIRGTLLRKHVATNAYLLGLNDQEITDLANHLGHSEAIHKANYRIPIETREIVDMSRLLIKSLKKPETVTSNSYKKEIKNVPDLENLGDNFDKLNNTRSSNDSINSMCQNDFKEQDNSRFYFNLTEQENLSLQNVANEVIADFNESPVTIEGNVHDMVEQCLRDIDESLTSNKEETVIENKKENTEKVQELDVNEESDNKKSTCNVQSEKIEKVLKVVLTPLNMQEEERYNKFNKDVMESSLQNQQQNESDSENDQKLIVNSLECQNQSNSQSNSDDEIDNVFSLQKYQTAKVTRKSWTTPEKSIVKKVFKNNFKNKQLPSFQACKDAVNKYGDLQNRTAKQLYAWINNNIKKSECWTQSSQTVTKRSWSTPERKLVKKHFHNFIQSATLPPFRLCQLVAPKLEGRTANHLYAYVNNQIQKLKKQPGYGKYSPKDLKYDVSVGSPSKHIIHSHFAKKIKDGKIPSNDECATFILETPELHNKCVNYIQDCVKHEINRKKFVRKLFT